MRGVHESIKVKTVANDGTIVSGNSQRQSRRQKIFSDLWIDR